MALVFRNDSINTGYMNPYSPEHAVVTSVNTFGTTNQSVSVISIRVKIADSPPFSVKYCYM